MRIGWTQVKRFRRRILLHRDGAEPRNPIDVRRAPFVDLRRLLAIRPDLGHHGSARTLTTLLDVVVVFLFTKPLLTLIARNTFFSSGHSWSGLDPKRLGAKPPLRRTRRPVQPAAGPVDPKEA
jgi:hypothetical protein